MKRERGGDGGGREKEVTRDDSVENEGNGKKGGKRVKV